MMAEVQDFHRSPKYRGELRDLIYLQGPRIYVKGPTPNGFTVKL